MSWYDCLNKCNSSFRRNVVSDEADWTSSSRIKCGSCNSLRLDWGGHVRPSFVRRHPWDLCRSGELAGVRRTASSHWFQTGRPSLLSRLLIYFLIYFSIYLYFHNSPVPLPGRSPEVIKATKPGFSCWVYFVLLHILFFVVCSI